jgi:hypothetical protein
MMILGQPIVQLDGPEHDDSIKTRKKIAIFGVGAIALLVGFYTYASYMATQNYRQVELEAEKAQQEYQRIKQEREKSSGDNSIVCIQVITSARNKETGEVRDFPTPCDVPEGWEKL